MSITKVKGVAHSFGGSGLNRVDVSIDGGKTWTASDLYKPDDLLRTERFQKMFGWCQFSKKVPRIYHELKNKSDEPKNKKWVFRKLIFRKI